ncbi:hypothetical protein [Pontibacter sp. SGAir0037]|uniref:hypothetical protein n=1 Tax=Pontibacter sp. SGAir0037 TaxID=2571030 RepID=UPI0010CCD591|nr:hypothetical protein [Pontibacter sp. SGAir0037]QCR22058.1 hypothetical protein C1N53_06695 [Pontibacter sp. SGAir0037]
MGCARKGLYHTSPLAGDPQMLLTADSVIVQAGKHYRRSGFHRLVFGRHYREVWYAPVKARVLHLDKEKGGLTVVKQGGSMQTLSLTLNDSAGAAYALRSVDKDPSGGLSPFLQKTFAADFLRDQTAALHPYAALVVAPLAEAAGIMQPSPALYYLPNEQAVPEEFRAVAGDKVYLLEEKTSLKSLRAQGLSDANDLLSTKKMLKERYKQQGQYVDETAFAKARLFDLFLNDRDRHDGQWEWAARKQNGHTVYLPVPEDRDQAFYNFSQGFIPEVFGDWFRYQKFTSFKGNYKNLKALLVKSKFMDNRLLSGVTETQFDSLAKSIQAQLTDDVLKHAVRNLPPPVYAVSGGTLLQKLQQRRDKLPELAKAYYQLLARKVIITGTNEAEIFKITRLDDRNTLVEVFGSDGQERMYSRVFETGQTQELVVYGLSGKDTFKVTGHVKKGIRLSIVGGTQTESYTVNASVRGAKRYTVIYDQQGKAGKLKAPDLKVARTRKAKAMAFDRKP